MTSKITTIMSIQNNAHGMEFPLTHYSSWLLPLLREQKASCGAFIFVWVDVFFDYIKLQEF